MIMEFIGDGNQIEIKVRMAIDLNHDKDKGASSAEDFMELGCQPTNLGKANPTA